jgi:spermidine/putrescine transport system permease protein
MKKNRILNILPLISWQILFLLTPFFLLFYNYFSFKSIYNTTLWLIQNNYFKILYHTFKTAFFVSCICLTISYLIAHCITQQNKFVQKFCLFMFFIPFLSSFLIHMLSLMNLFYKTGIISFIYELFPFWLKQDNLLYSQFLVYLGYIYCYLPYSFIPLYNSLSKFNVALLKASADLGATFWQTIFKILIPNTKKAIINSFFLVFVAASGEFIITEILGGDKYMHAGSIISYTLLSGNLVQYSIIMILFFIISLITILPILYHFLLFVIYYMQKA